jgi:hypothetical protein
VKRVSILALAAVAALALTAAIGAGTASATVLCKSNASETCPSLDLYGNETKLSASLEWGTNLTIETGRGEIIYQCKESKIEAQVSDAGGEGKAVTTKDSAYSFGGCTGKATLLKAGKWEIKSSGSGNGEIIDWGTVLQIEVLGFTCEYEFAHNSELRGSSSLPKIYVHGHLERVGTYYCPPNLWMSGTYNVTPVPLFVEQHGPQATTLCKAAEEHCSEANRYAPETKLAASLKSGTSFQIERTNAEIWEACTSSTIEGKVTDAGGGFGGASLADVSGMSVGGCTWTTVAAAALPWHTEIVRTATVGNGTQTIRGFKIEVNTGTLTCIWGGNPTFAVTGGSEPELRASHALLERQGGSALCPTKMYLNATYVLSAPTPLYVTAP